MHSIELKEYEQRSFVQDALEECTGRQIWLRYSDKIEISPPTFQTLHQWYLKPKGWVGHIPIDKSLSLLIKPKVDLSNLFRMLEYAYRIKFTRDDYLVKSDSLPEFYQRLANILAKQVLQRIIRGLYKEYISCNDRLQFLKGRLKVEKMIDKPWQVEPDCHYQVITSDNEENRILAWTLFCIARTGLCKDTAKRNVRKACRGVCNFAAPVPIRPGICIGRHYNRLNFDYESMHALCRFFLEVTGPFHNVGNKSMLPFLIDMPKLYEEFVAEWLKQYLAKHYPGKFRLKKQAPLKIGLDNKVEFRIDMVLEDVKTGRHVCLMDTKYKVEETPSASDLQQVIAYAKALGCKQAFLIYPNSFQIPFSALVGGDIHVQAITFGLDGDLEENGRTFFEQIARLAGEAFSYSSI